MQLLRPSALALLALVAIALTPSNSSAALDEQPCRLLHPLLPAAFALCAELEVPVAYGAGAADGSPGSDTLSLFFARVPALTADPAPDPLVLINGGPGGSTVDLYLQLRDAFEPIRRERDILLLDQRGTGRSLSGLDCELPEDFELVTAGSDEIRTVVDNCIAEFAYDPRYFTTSLAVRDLETLREALAIDTWNIYGVSYGTRVAQHYLRLFEPRVRTMILDGVVPAELPLGPGIAGDAQRALDAIFARCALAPACNERFGALDERFAELKLRFEDSEIEVFADDPFTGERMSVLLDESHLQGVVRLMSYSDETAALLPLVIDAAHQGNYKPLAAQAELQIEALAESIGFAMHNSVVCTEDAPFFAQRAESDESTTYLGTAVVEGLSAICDSWPAGVIDESFKQPVSSSRPVLLLSGEHDPVTPPAYADRVIDTGLANARHVIGPGQGHGLARVGCMPRLMREFIESADPARPDAACLDAEPPMPFFLSFQGPAP